MTGEQQRAAVVITAGGSPVAYDIVRSLALQGLRTTVASSHLHDIAFYSRYCAEKVVLPSFERCNDELILHALEWLAMERASGDHSEEKKPVLFYASDPELSFVWRHRYRLARHYQFLLPPDNLFEHLFDKVKFASFAKGQRLPVPATFVAKSLEELREVLLDIPMPCIVKPGYSEDWNWKTEEQCQKFGPYKKALRRFASHHEVWEFCEQLPQWSSGIVIQSYLEGRDETITSFHGYFNRASHCLGYFLGRKIRTYPPHTGGSTFIETIDDHNLAVRSIELLQQVGFRGVVKVDYKWDKKANDYKILEINPRYTLWELLGAHAGANLAWIAYQNQRGEHVEVQRQYTVGRRLLYWKQDLRAVIDGYRTSSEWTWLSYLRSIAGKSVYRIFNPHDPLPFFVSLLGFLRRNILLRLRIHALVEALQLMGDGLAEKTVNARLKKIWKMVK